MGIWFFWCDADSKIMEEDAQNNLSWCIIFISIFFQIFQKMFSFSMKKFYPILRMQWSPDQVSNNAHQIHVQSTEN